MCISIRHPVETSTHLCALQRTSREMDAVFRMQSMSSAASGQLLGKR